MFLCNTKILKSVPLFLSIHYSNQTLDKFSKLLIFFQVYPSLIQQNISTCISNLTRY